MPRIRIGQALVEMGLLDDAELEEALTAQQIYGGRLGTILVEHGFVKEDDLARCLARQHGVPWLRREALADLPASLIGLVPRAIAEKYQIVPYDFDAKRTLHVATANAASLQLLDELQFVLERGRVEAALCPEIVIARAMEKYYGIAREKRFITLAGAARTRTRRDGSSSKTAANASSPARTEGSSRPQEMTLLQRIAAASAPEQLLDDSVQALTAFGAQSAFLALRGDAFVGWSARGLAIEPERLATERVSLERSGLGRRLLIGRQTVRMPPGAEDPIPRFLRERVGFCEDGDLVAIPLFASEAALGTFVVGALHPDRTADPTLLAEIARRIGLRLHAMRLTEQVLAPLAGLPE